jgi:hypothetical protein
MQGKKKDLQPKPLTQFRKQRVGSMGNDLLIYVEFGKKVKGKRIR